MHSTGEGRARIQTCLQMSSLPLDRAAAARAHRTHRSALLVGRSPHVIAASAKLRNQDTQWGGAEG